MSDDFFKPKKESAQPAKPKGGMLRLILFAFVALMFFSKMFKGNNTEADGTALPDEGRVRVESPQRGAPVPNPQGGLPNYGKQLPSKDWKLDDLEADTRPSESLPQRANTPRQSTTRSDSGDWSLDEVETKRKSTDADNQTVFDPRGTAGKSDKPKKTTKGDWSIEEVETK